MASSAQFAENVIFPGESEAYIQELKPMGVDIIGSDKWSVQRERIEKLTMQAISNVAQKMDEFVTNQLISHDKVAILIHELVCVDLWKRNVFSLLFKQSVTPTTGFPTYLILYHEASLVSLLEVVLFYRESCENLNETVLDLIDYTHRKITELIMNEDVKVDNENGGMEAGESPESIIKEMKEQETKIAFGVQMKSLSILHYISDHLSVQPLSVSTHLLNTHDFPYLLVSVIERSPWTRAGEEGQLMKYEDGKWREIEQIDRLKVTKLEGQVWLTLYRLLLDEKCRTKYEFSSYRKQCLMKLQGYLIDPLLEQIPYLADLQRYLQHLSLMEPPAAKTALILEQIPVLYSQIIKDWGEKWEELAEKQSKHLLEPDPERLKAQATRWIDSYNFEVLENLVEGPLKCSLCGKEATKRCSRCRSEWYCGRECQVKHWKKHKAGCDMLHQALNS